MLTGLRKGFTLIELLVVFGVVALLLAVLLPAVQYARAAASNIKCLSNLRQMALSVHNYHDVHSMVPSWWHQSGVTALGGEESHFSIHAQLLPYLDQSIVFDSINFRRSLAQPYADGADTIAVQRTAAMHTIQTFLCPADGLATQWPGANSYRGNWGGGPYWINSAEFPDSANGIFCSPSMFALYPVRIGDIFDGTSKTAMFTERVVGSGVGFDQFRDINDIAGLNPRTAPETRAMCVAAAVAGDRSYANAGKYWIYTGIHQTLYTHILPPNSVVTDCQMFGAAPPWGAGTARSFHAGAVNVAMADGSARSISDKVSLNIWAALGTRNGREIILDSSF